MFNHTSVDLERGRGKRKANEKIENSEDRREKRKGLLAFAYNADKPNAQTLASTQAISIERWSYALGIQSI